MSRSKRKNWYSSNTSAESEKQDKRRANRKFRRKARVQIICEQELVKDIIEVSNIWDWDKDGKSPFTDAKYVRK